MNQSTLDPLSYRHIHMDAEGQTFYLGSLLPLTPMEHTVLRCLILTAVADPMAHISPETVDCWVSRHAPVSRRAPTKGPEPVQLHRLFDDIPPPPVPMMSKQQIAVYVHRINQKAQIIGDRRLILSKRGQGYRLNPHM